jgi:hypothetical protein
VRAWWRELRAELAYLAGVTWLEARMVRLSPGQVSGELAAMEARRRLRSR